MLMPMPAQRRNTWPLKKPLVFTGRWATRCPSAGVSVRHPINPIKCDFLMYNFRDQFIYTTIKNQGWPICLTYHAQLRDERFKFYQNLNFCIVQIFREIIFLRFLVIGQRARIPFLALTTRARMEIPARVVYHAGKNGNSRPGGQKFLPGW